MAYASESERNREDYGVSGVITVPVSTDSPLSGGLHASYGRNTNVSESVGDLVTTKALNIGANGGYAFSERLSGTASFNYGTNENENYGDNKSWSGSAGLSFSQLIFRRLPLSLSYTYSSQESTDDPTSARKLDTKSHSFNVGTNGQISSKVQGSISVGVRSTDDNGTGSGSFGGNSGFVASTGLNWAYDELTTVRLSVSKSLAVTTDNQSTDSTMIGIGYSRKLSEQLSANAGANYSLQNYTAQDRKDTMIGLSGGLSYQIRRNWSAGVNYSYTQNFAGVAFNDFDRHVIGATVTGRF